MNLFDIFIIFEVLGPASLARENEAGGSWGQEVHLLHVNIIGLSFVLVVIIELSGNSVFNTVILSEGLLQAEAVEHFAGDNDHGNHEF